MTAYVKAIATNRNKFGLAWHGLDQYTESLSEDDTVSSAMVKADMLDIHVDKYPTYIHVGEHQILANNKQLVMTSCNWTNNGMQLLDRGVSWYTPVQNKQYGKILDPLTRDYPVAGVLMCGERGEVVVVQLEMPEYMIANHEEERHQPFLLVAENRKSGLKTFGTVHTRVVCMNTYNMAIGEKGEKSLPNSEDSHAILQFRTRIEQKAIASQTQYIDNLNHLFKKKVNNDDISNLIDELFPKPKKPQMVKIWENNQDILNGDETSQTIDKRGQRAKQLFANAIERNKKYERELVENFFKFNDEHSYAANTAYGLFQATTEFYNHSQMWHSNEDKHLFNVHFGDKAKQMTKAMSVLSK